VQPLVDTEPISVVVVTHSYPPVLGGAEVEVQRVSAALVARGHSVAVLCAANPGMPDTDRWVDSGGVAVRMFGRGRRDRALNVSFALGVAVTLFLRRRDYRVVYFLSRGVHLAAGLPVARWLKKPILMKFSGSYAISAMGQTWMGRLELRWLKQWAQRVMVLNPDMLREAASVGLDAARLQWMPNPVDTAVFAPCSAQRRLELRKELDLRSDAPVAMFTGRLSPEKDLPSLLAAFANVVHRLPGSVLSLVGDGVCRDALAAQCASLGISKSVRFAGGLDATGVRRWLQASDVFVLVSPSEGLSCALLEAMAVGLPSVVSEIPANTQVIDAGVHGLYVRPGDTESIADGLCRLLAAGGERTLMGIAARERIFQDFSTDRVAARYEDLLRRVVVSGPG
jgi:L-malate glycosyltransferase